MWKAIRSIVPGAEDSADYVECENCGSELEAASEQCPSCGSENFVRYRLD